MEKLKLNDFEKKTVLAALKEFDIVNLIAYNHTTTGNVYYTIFYRHKEFIFTVCLFFTNETQFDRSIVISYFVDGAKKLLTNSISNLDNLILRRKPVIDKKIDQVTDHMENLIIGTHRDYSDFNFITSSVDRGRGFSVKSQCEKLLREGHSAIGALRIYLNDIGITNDHIMTSRIESLNSFTDN